MIFCRSLLIAYALALLSGCGGGSADSSATASVPAASAANGSQSAGDGTVPAAPASAAVPAAADTSSTPGTPSTPDLPSFAAQLIDGPPDNTFLGFEPYLNSATFVVAGIGMENVELVSANDERILYGRFTLSPDKTRATLDWRYRDWPYGSWNLKIIAWDVPPGQTGRRIDVASRQYLVHLPLGCQAEGTCGMPAP